MNILQVVQSYYPATIYGGPIFSIHDTCSALAALGVRVHVATTNANGDDRLDVPTHKPVKMGENYFVHYYDDTIISRFSWDFTRHLGRDMRNADIVHLHDIFSTYAVWTMLLAWRQDKPLIISPRGSLTPWGLVSKRPWLKKFWLNILVRPLVRNAERVAWHATSDAERDEILAQFPKARVFVIPNGMNCAEYAAVQPPSRPAWFRQFFPDSKADREKAFVFVGLGRLHAKKAFDVAISAMHSIRAKGVEAVLVIAGTDDGERQRLQTIIHELALNGYVRLAGEITGTDKIAFLKGADMLLFPSHGENFGMVALEALSAGLPVIASRHTPWREIADHDAGAWVENDPESFASAALELMRKDPQIMRENAVKLAQRYDIKSIAEAFIDIYKEKL